MNKITVKEMKHDGLVDAAVTTASFMRVHRSAFLILAIIIVVGAAVVAAFVSHSTSLIDKSTLALSQARTKEDLLKVFEEYSETPSAPLAVISLASLQYNEGEFGSARESYQKFLKHYPDHSLAGFAEMGAGFCLESEGELEAAVDKYEGVINLYPNSSLGAEAALNVARCRVGLGRFQDAIASCREVIENYPQSLYAALAREELVHLLYLSRDSG